MVLIGEGSKEAGDLLEIMYRDMVENSPSVKRMCVPMLLILKNKNKKPIFCIKILGVWTICQVVLVIPFSASLLCLMAQVGRERESAENH